MECPVCLETKTTCMTTICGHTFCTACVGQVVVTTLKCPLCRGLLMDEDISSKALNNTIRSILPTISKKKKKAYWKAYQDKLEEVSLGLIVEDDLGVELIGLLIQAAGERARSLMKVQMLEAVVHRETYLKAPSEDWRNLFL